MKPVFNVTSGLIFLLTANLLWAAAGQAELDCSCKQQDWKEAFDRSNHVVFGEIKEVQVHAPNLATGKFKTLETFKGDSDFVKQLVGSGNQNASCRKKLNPGFYIVFTEKDSNVVLNPCVASRQLMDDLVTTLTITKKYADTGVITDSGHSVNTETKSASEESDWFQDLIDWFESW